MVKFIEFLGRLVVRGYARAASVERKVAEVSAKGAEVAAKEADSLRIKSLDAGLRARGLDKKAEQLKAFFE